jgi:release factor glutamine methyltransferase
MKAETDRQARALACDVRAALRVGMARLRAAEVPSHTLAAELLLMHALGHDRTWIYSHPDEFVDRAALDGFLALIARRAAGEPTQYLTGRQEFWGLEFEVTPAVLIPRPETEHVVEIALERLGPSEIEIKMATGAPSAPLKIADVGTGSGCLAVSLANELPHAELVATDISAEALVVAGRNAERHGVSGRIRYLQTDLLASVHEARSFDIIVSNPPYIGRNEAGQLPREVREHEPDSALFGGPTGVEIYARLVEQSRALLRRGGILVLELGYNSADHVRGLLDRQPAWVNVSVTNDLSGIPRVIAAERA